MGDPVRCPECGKDNPRELLQLSPTLIAKYLRKLETIPTWCVAGMLGTAIHFLLYWSGYALPCTMIITIPCFVLWPAAVLWFARSCGFRYGWLHALGWYHLAGLSLIILFAMLPLIASALEPLAGDRGSNAIATVILLLLMLPGNKLGPFYVYKEAKAKLDAFCRPLAIELARQDLRRIEEGS